MRLKTLLLPFAIILTLVIVIGYIKPDIATFQEKKIDLETKTKQAQSMSTLIANVTSLETTLAAQTEVEKLVHVFTPTSMDQERAIDTFNFLASQSGVLINTMSMSVIKKKASDELNLDPVTGVEIISFKPKVETFSADVEVTGTYESISDFFSRLAHTNRFHMVQNFTLSVPGATEPGAGNGILLGVIATEFDYFPRLQVGSALDVPVFIRGNFDEANLAELKDWQRHAVPTLQEPVSGRPNPFQ